MAVTEMKKGVRYADMTDGQMLAACGDNAWNWAHAFQQLVVERGHRIDVDVMIGWFANAIENSQDVRNGNGVTVLPDGSAFFTGEVVGG